MIAAVPMIHAPGVAAAAFIGLVVLAINGHDVTTIIVAVIGAVSAIASALIGASIRRELPRRRIVMTREKGRTIVHDEHLPSDPTAPIQEDEEL